MAEYRRKKNSDTWHWCSNCRDYPTEPGTYESSKTKPTSGELDNECRAKEKAGNCS